MVDINSCLNSSIQPNITLMLFLARRDGCFLFHLILFKIYFCKSDAKQPLLFMDVTTEVASYEGRWCPHCLSHLLCKGLLGELFLHQKQPSMGTTLDLFLLHKSDMWEVIRRFGNSSNYSSCRKGSSGVAVDELINHHSNVSPGRHQKSPMQCSRQSAGSKLHLLCALMTECK